MLGDYDVCKVCGARGVWLDNICDYCRGDQKCQE